MERERYLGYRAPDAPHVDWTDEQLIDEVDFIANFRPTNESHEWWRWRLHGMINYRHFFFKQHASKTRQELRHCVRARMRSVCRAKAILHKNTRTSAFSYIFCKLHVVCLFFRIKPQIFKQNDTATRCMFYRLVHLVPHAIVDKLH